MNPCWLCTGVTNEARGYLGGEPCPACDGTGWSLDRRPGVAARSLVLSPPGTPGGQVERAEPSPAELDGIRPCGAYADHVDHLLPRHAAAGQSALKSSGSTSRWRRIRRWVLDRDGWRCQVLVDLDGQVVEAERPTIPPTGPDDPAWLRAACPAHNLQRGGALTDAGTRNRRTPTRWSW